MCASPETVSLRIGERDFTIHKTLLCLFSRYYAAALNGIYKESSDGLKPIEGSSASARLGEELTTWLYSGRLTSMEDLPFLYILADRYEFSALRRDILAALRRSYKTENSCPPYDVVNTAFEDLPTTSALCRLYVDRYVEHWDPGFDDKDEAEKRATLHQDFLQNVLVRSALVRARKDRKACRCCSDAGVDVYFEDEDKLHGSGGAGNQS